MYIKNIVLKQSIRLWGIEMDCALILIEQIWHISVIRTKLINSAIECTFLIKIGTRLRYLVNENNDIILIEEVWKPGRIQGNFSTEICCWTPACMYMSTIFGIKISMNLGNKNGIWLDNSLMTLTSAVYKFQINNNGYWIKTGDSNGY